MSLGTWLLGGLGFVLGGPIGALIGAVVGSLLGSVSSTSALPSGDDEEPTQKRRRKPRATQADVKVSILILAAAVMKADGHIKKTELDEVKKFLRSNFSEKDAKEMLQVLKQLLEKDIDYESVADQISVYVNYSIRLEIVRLLLAIAHSDDDFAAQEEYIISRIVHQFAISQSDYNSLLSLYKKTRDVNWAYQALEIDPSASDDEVKKAYRRMAMKYHPDKVASAGDDIKQMATEKFRAVNEAYEHIKRLRGLV